MKIVVIDYNIGNVQSILNAIKKVGFNATLSKDKDEILQADGVILPGVGSFAQGMKNLYDYDLVDTIKEYADSSKPLLGICLGMQLLFDKSEEFGKTDGLGLIDGEVVKLNVNAKLPHISWNEVDKNKIDWDGSILSSIPTNQDFYFVHSYIVIPKDENHILATTTYCNYKFCSVVKKQNIYGTQFHPEKSAKNGLKIIENFIKEISNVR